MNAPISVTGAEHYVWGNSCDGWHLVRTPELSVIQEHMGPGSSEERHFHEGSRQFFYVIAGEAVLEVNGTEHCISQQQGLEIPPGIPHQIFNRTSRELRFLVISQPPSHGDRVVAADMKP